MLETSQGHKPFATKVAEVDFACADQLRLVSKVGDAQTILVPTKLASFPQPVSNSAGVLQSVQNDLFAERFNGIEFLRGQLAWVKFCRAGIYFKPSTDGLVV